MLNRYQMSARVLFFLILSMQILTMSAFAQLSVQLKQESPEQLAVDAMQNGSAVKGALLFPQQSLECTSCHISGDNNVLGPDLSRLPKERTNVMLVESLLNPSKVITKGFESTTIVTTAGKTHVGRLLSESEDSIMLRESTGDRRRVSFRRSDIEQIHLSNKSLMPDGLADKLANRQQLLDLVRYLIELRDTSTVDKSDAHIAGGETLAPHLSSLVMLDRFQCISCHRNDLAPLPMTHQRAPRLEWLAGRLDPHYIQQFITNPTHSKPGTNMPNVLSGVPESERSTVARQITHFLVQQSNAVFKSTSVDEASAIRGKELYHSVGCVACHSPLDDNGNSILETSSVKLGHMKYSVEGLTDFLENPLKARPSGRMPNMKLDHWEAIDLANYLLSTTKLNPSEDFVVDPILARAGQKQFAQHQCNVCHGETDDLRIQMQRELPSLASVRTDRGCLSQVSGNWPLFNLTDSERLQLADGIEHLRNVRELTREQQIQVSMTALQCSACHQRGTFGGITDQRNDHFQTTNPNLGPQGRIPPPLTGVGTKLNSKWMREILVSGRSIRPYMKTRMPQFGTGNVEHLIGLLQSDDRLPEVEFPVVEGREPQKSFRDAGFSLVSNDGLNCIACHTFQLKPAQTMPAVDLTEMHERLKPDWFYHYMRNPKQFHRGTVMPSFWPDGRSVRQDVLDGDSYQQIAAIWEWMKDGRQARTPRGLIRKPMQLLASDEAVMLRRSYPGIGKRGIGVGYPSEVNLAFDAEQMRVAMMWQGQFADPAGVWLGQGHGRVNPLSRERIEFHPGPELDDLNNPSVVDDGRPPEHRFLGYILDDVRRPTFLYQFRDVTVRDYTVDVKSADSDPARMQRTITLTAQSNQKNLAFRISPKNELVQISENQFEIAERVILTVTGGADATLEKTETGQQIVIPVSVVGSRPTTLVLEYRWNQQAK